MSSTPQKLLNPATFPVDPRTCKPISPSQYLKVNTIFNVAHDAGMLTAWSDKHPVYTSFNGPAGNGITDSFDPEIDSGDLPGTMTPGPLLRRAIVLSAKHGGANPADRDVPFVVDAPGVAPRVIRQTVETTQIAPTIVTLLGLNPDELQAVRKEGTEVLPGTQR